MKVGVLDYVCNTIKKITFDIFQWIGLQEYTTRITQRSHLPNRKTFERLLERSGSAVLLLDYSCPICAPFLSERIAYHSQKLIFAFSACHVSQISRSISRPQTIGAYTYDDKRNGIVVLLFWRNIYLNISIAILLFYFFFFSSKEIIHFYKNTDRKKSW